MNEQQKQEEIWKYCMDKYNNANNDNNMMRQAIDGFLNYQCRYQNGIYYNEADGYITELRFKFASWKLNEIENMRRNPQQYNRMMLRQWFEDGTFKPNELIDAGLITERGLAIYMDPPDLFTPMQEWGEIYALPEDSTDVYFFGLPGTGKSCIIAGLLYAADIEGILHPDIANGRGYQYMYQLQKSVRLGYVPPSTAMDKMNYIKFDLRGRKTHPISLIEMNCDYVNKIIIDIYNGAITEETENLMKCMGHNNRKALFFVVDYTEAYGSIGQQSHILTGVLKFLEDNGILSKTDSIQIIVSKSDRMPEGDKMEIAKDFLRNNCRSFINIVESLCAKYGINRSWGCKPVVIPFSLGRFMLGCTYEYDKSSSVNLINNLMNVTAIRKEDKHGFWDRIFRRQ
jgi:hypothetical protein